MACRDFKDLNRRTVVDKLLHHKSFNITKNPKYDVYQRALALMVNTVFDKKHLLEQLKIKLFLIKNQQKNYTNQLLEKIEKRKAHSFSIDNICGADLADMQLISNLIKEFGFL